MTEAEKAALAAGRQRVREILLAGLDGLPRKKGMTLADHETGLRALVERLAYMTEPNLRGLAELVLRQAAVGASHPRWPEFVVVVAWAYGLQPPPPRISHYAQSLIRSVEGRKARDGGYLVELFQIAKRLGPPPGKYVVSKLREQADDNRRRRRRIRERIDAGTASPDDCRWLESWWADQRECEALLGGDENGVAA